jgi:hypothetical protein
VQLSRQCEAETGAAACRSIVGSNASAMRFNNGTGNGQTKSHPRALGCEETVKEMIEMLRLDARAAVFESAE